MSKKKDIIRMWVARNETAIQCYVTSFEPIKPLASVLPPLDYPRHWQGAGLWKEILIHPEMFEQMFDFHLNPGEGPFLVEFPKIAMKAVKK